VSYTGHAVKGKLDLTVPNRGAEKEGCNPIADGHVAEEKRGDERNFLRNMW
jgi:hypothetical protein